MNRPDHVSRPEVSRPIVSLGNPKDLAHIVETFQQIRNEARITGLREDVLLFMHDLLNAIGSYHHLVGVLSLGDMVYIVTSMGPNQGEIYNVSMRLRWQIDRQVLDALEDRITVSTHCLREAVCQAVSLEGETSLTVVPNRRLVHISRGTTPGVSVSEPNCSLAGC